MNTFVHHVELAAPLFVLVLVGYVLMRGFGWPQAMSDNLSRFVFSVALPAMLFRMMSDFSQLPPVDARLLIAFFGGCLIVFVIGRLVAWQVFALDGVGQSVFALGGVFSNNVLLGVPLAKVALGDAALPSVALVLVFNALILWTLLTVSIEWAQHGSFSMQGFAKTARGVLTNPIVAAILSGTLFGLAGLPLPTLVALPLGMVGQAAAPMALIALGMGLAEYGVGDGWRISVAISVLKLIVQPLVVWLLARLIGLPAMETRVVVLLASLAVGVNVYLMSRQFKTLEGPVASSMVLSTALAALTTPLALTLLGG
ncbi:Auxin Efflux Carrier [Candidatus Accumulibacter aalborgensis]|uniref:Auxin Efflux Carrier n=1 Tax=Candidatus Accumulibacter aalborgensis TaxID=1860102 RepID=A0A1A8XVH2_9PROT|nr:AEC family transporter [Candidatus Accumulibacter aalborgensis]SBT08592.1 Auxin Efflux Carrier [Candidatus Accumulibacter aalborgensis]